MVSSKISSRTTFPSLSALRTNPFAGFSSVPLVQKTGYYAEYSRSFHRRA